MRPLNVSKLGLWAGVLTIALAIALIPGLSVAGSGQAWLGVSLQDLDRDLRDALDLRSGTRGIVVNSVMDDSPADDAGIRSNDVITAVDGRRVDGYDDLTDIMDDRDPGDTVSIDVIRGDNERSFDVRLGNKDDAPSFTFFSGDDDNRWFSDDGDDRHMVIDLDDLQGGNLKELLEDSLDGRFMIDVDEDDGRIEITIRDDEDDDNDDRRVIILGDDDDDPHRDRHRARDRNRNRNRDRDRKVIVDRRTDKDNDGNVFVWRGDEGHSMNRRDAGYLGVSTTSLGDQLAAYFGVSSGEGVLIEDVVDDSPAEKAGLRAGDIILRVNGESIDGPTDLLREIRDHEAGDEVDIDLLRDKKKRTITVRLGEAEDFGSLMELQELGPRLHALGRDLHQMIPEMEIHSLHGDIQGHVQEALKEAHRGLKEHHRALRGKHRDMRKKLELKMERNSDDL